MKRRIATGTVVGVILSSMLSGGCSEQTTIPADPPPGSVSSWTAPPHIETVDQTPGVLIFRGVAQPGGRVVLRSTAGAAHASGADADGRFEIRMAVPDEDLMLYPEAQVGQDAIPAPERLLIIRGGRGPIVLLRSGRASRRLDQAPALAAIDSDGHVMLVSGQVAGSPQTVRVAVGDGPEIGASPDSHGHWTAVFNRVGTVPVRLNGVVFTYPGDATPVATDMSVARAGAGWRVGWKGGTGAPQTTWLPDRVG